jgi:hypothetical protein
MQSIKNQLEKKNQERNKLLGQKEMILQSLKDLGFDKPKQAEIEVKKLTKKIDKLKEKHKEGTELFVKKYKDLLD